MKTTLFWIACGIGACAGACATIEIVGDGSSLSGRTLGVGTGQEHPPRLARPCDGGAG